MSAASTFNSTRIGSETTSIEIAARSAGTESRRDWSLEREHLLRSATPTWATLGQYAKKRDAYTSMYGRELRGCVLEYHSELLGSITYQAVLTAPRYRNRQTSSTGSAEDPDNDLEWRKTLTVVLPFLHWGFAFQTSTLYRRWARTLRVSPVIDWKAPVLRLCSSGDLAAIQELFQLGQASPFDSTHDGYTLLHVSKPSGLVGWRKLLTMRAVGGR